MWQIEDRALVNNATRPRFSLSITYEMEGIPMKQNGHVTAVHQDGARPFSSRPKEGVSASAPRKPLALVVFLENVGHIAGLNLPAWAMNAIDFVTEEYAKLLLRLLHADRYYDRIVILEDEQATGIELANVLLRTSLTHRIDLLLLVHGLEKSLVGHKNQEFVDAAVFEPLVQAYGKNPALLDLRVVYGVNCYGASLAPTWLALGAEIVNGAVGVNWLPEPSLSLFLRAWLGGESFSRAVSHSHEVALKTGRLLWPAGDRDENPRIAGSRQIIFGRRDLRIWD